MKLSNMTDKPPLLTKVGSVEVLGEGRNVRIKTPSTITTMLVERADVPDLIEALIKAYE